MANDGIFFFPVDKFLTRFTQMSLGYYNENWKQVSYLNKGADPSRSKPTILYIDNPMEQEVIFQFEHTPDRMVPAGCKKFQTNYNLYFLTAWANNWSVRSTYSVQGFPVPSGLNTRAKHYEKMPAGKSRIKVINW